MLKALRSAAGVLLKLALSLVAIGAFLYISARAPFLRDGLSWPSITPDLAGASGLAEVGAPPATVRFATEDARFSGSFFAGGGDAGFELTEVDVAGPCSGAGERYLRDSCPNCLLSPAPAEPGQPATLFWSQTSSGGTAMGTVFRDCERTLPKGEVRVPLLSFTDDAVSLAGAAPDTVPVPRLADAERTSHMTLGNWAVTVDMVSANSNALDAMGSLLLEAGWDEVAQGGHDAAQQDQRVYERDGAQLCVVTLNTSDEGYQLVTMMTI